MKYKKTAEISSQSQTSVQYPNVKNQDVNMNFLRREPLKGQSTKIYHNLLKMNCTNELISEK